LTEYRLKYVITYLAEHIAVDEEGEGERGHTCDDEQYAHTDDHSGGGEKKREAQHAGADGRVG
jgi:hypothetical protein